MNDYELLLKSWCDRLIDLQITELKDPNFHGGILCPACAMIHGRIADAVYPLTLMYDRTKEEKYLDAAKLIVDWSEYNLTRSDGGYYNDKCSGWKGISVFSATALGDTLLYHADCLDRETKDKWYGIFLRLAEFVYDFFDKNGRTNVNYYATICPVMAFAYKFTGNEKYKTKAYQRFEWMKQQFTQEGLLFGEGPDKTTEKDCKYVDIGYNVEESLPALAVFAHLMEDEEALQFVAQKFAAHIEFMLPDGAWDNSWGTRSNKWTYWGSRTSDGAATGLCYLEGDLFSEAVERNFRLMEKCSENGFLYGGPHYSDFGEDACLHHSFCHAKALAVMIDTGFRHEKTTPLPREAEYGVKTFPSTHVNLISKGSFRATFTDNDAIDYFKITLSGGTMSALWDNTYGMIFSASAPSFNDAFTEPRNMQLSRVNDTIPNCTLRIQRNEYLSQNDREAKVAVEEHEDNITVTVNGTLRDIRFAPDAEFSIKYVFSDHLLRITAMCSDNAELIIPIVSLKSDKVQLSDDTLCITRDSTALKAQFPCAPILPQGCDYRDISLIGGFETLPVKAELKAGTPFTFQITLSRQ